LRQENRSLSRKSHFYENIIVDDVAEEIEVAPDTCSDCGKGNLIKVDLAFMDIITCDVCDHREVIKTKKKKK
jgi:DNA-directed RNA polymerase subunit RPC12/RpoP